MDDIDKGLFAKVVLAPVSKVRDCAMGNKNEHGGIEHEVGQLFHLPVMQKALSPVCCLNMTIKVGYEGEQKGLITPGRVWIVLDYGTSTAPYLATKYLNGHKREEHEDAHEKCPAYCGKRRNASTNVDWSREERRDPGRDLCVPEKDVCHRDEAAGSTEKDEATRNGAV